MFRFIHSADWQIGKPFGGFDPDDATLLAEARLAGVVTIARMAQDERVDSVLVAGDVFDAQGLSDKTIRQTFEAMNGFAGGWYLLPGNHDAALVESIWTRAARIGAVPANVHPCLQAVPVALRADVTLLPAPLVQRHTFEDLTEWYTGHETPAGVLRIGLAHGSVQGLLPEAIDSDNPIAADRAMQARLDYLALGDWHGTLQINERTWYAGTHETDRFRSNDSGNVLLVTLSPGQAPQVRPVRTGRYAWEALDFQLRTAADVQGMNAALARFGAEDVLDLKLAGAATMADAQAIRQTIDHLRGRVRALRTDDAALRLAPSADEIAELNTDGYLAEVLAELRAAANDTDCGATPAATDARLAGEALVLLANTLHEVQNKSGHRP